MNNHSISVMCTDLVDSQLYHEIVSSLMKCAQVPEVKPIELQDKCEGEKPVSSFRRPSQIAFVFGYVGIGHEAFFSTMNRNVPAVYNDILRALFATEFKDKKIKLTSLKSACKTPANGSALCQIIVMPNNGGNIEDRLKRINDHLPGYIRCFDGRKVPPTFNPKYSCAMDKNKINYQVLVNDTKIYPENFEERCLKEISQLKFREKIRSHVYQYSIRNSHLLVSVPQPRESLDFIQKAQISWERRIFKSLNSMYNELGIPLSKKRPISEQRDLEAKWCELSTEDIDLSRIRPLYSPKDFFDVLLNVRSSNWSLSSAGDSGATNVWGQIKVPLRVKTFSQIRKYYHELGIKSCHVGLENVGNDFLELGNKVLETLDPLLAREYTKFGCFPSIRTEMWSQILGAKSEDDDKLRFQQLKSYVIQHDMLVDKLIFKDIRLTSSNDDQYFVFEDVLYQILLAFTRDASVLDHFHGSSASPATGYLRGRLNQEGAAVIYPPNGVIPFHGFSMYLTPLCFLTEDPVLMYNIFKQLYCRYFFRLHTVSSHSQGILSLCVLLETLLQEIDPQLTYHFANKEIYPLKVAVKWLMRGFSGYLNTEQILLLWDRVLAYDTLEVLSIFAAAIFIFRKPFLMTAENQTNLEAMLSDIGTIKVVPLLSWFLKAPSTALPK